MNMECNNKCLVVACVVLLASLLAVAPAVAQCVPTGGFTRTYQQSTVGGTFIPPQTHVSDVFYSYPGVSAFGAYPGGGYAADYGVGFTPYGYTPYGAYTYL